MRAITYEKFGSAADVLQLIDMPTPTPGPGEVLVRLHASGVNPSDVKARAGARPGVTKPPFPTIIPHSDGAGVIESLGEGVSSDRIGQRVWIWNGQWQRAFGTAAEYICLPENQAVPLPENIGFQEGAVLGIPGLTAAHAVLGSGPVQGQTVLISGAAGTVGRLAVQVAVASGANVLATARGPAGFKSAKSAGAQHVFDYSDNNLTDQILDVTKGRLIERIVEVEFGKNIETNTELIAERGTIAAFGSAKNMTPALPFYPLMFKAARIDLLLIYLLSDGERTKAIEHLNSLLMRNQIELSIAKTLELADCAEAHDLVAAGNRFGSIILRT